ncbi:FAD:protein FMN transferase [Robiginitalea sp. SC105]|uniref:FAD:protein FMN transferase n=1 Tax=Robiginitalea sp. SC105 TaxID=2762332 RepID=UPI00163A6645|nr:FAD:protein FMN transferase [Robiginitalea sp. SC105]MBC2839038.1 FAD:protein FMN transferase [Robiginitalea sp. SC105]
MKALLRFNTACRAVPSDGCSGHPIRAARLFKSFGALLLFTVLQGCSSPDLERMDYLGEALGTTYAITVFSEEARDLQPKIDSVFAVLNQSMSTYLPGSDITRINNGDTTVVADAMFREVLAASREIHRATAGYFDPTVGVLVEAWGFGPGPALEQMDQATVDSLLRFVGLEKVELTPDNRIRKEWPQTRLDFNAIAKGYAVDRLAHMLETQGSSNFLVEVGGEVRTRGMQPEKNQPWRVGIDDPQAEGQRSIKRVVSLSDRAMASSGNYRKFRVDPETGTRYVHTIDPISGFTKNSNILAVSVIAPTCMVADGYATAFMAMDLQQSSALLEASPDLEAYIIYLDEAGETREFATEGFRTLMQP